VFPQSVGNAYICGYLCVAQELSKALKDSEDSIESRWGLQNVTVPFWSLKLNTFLCIQTPRPVFGIKVNQELFAEASAILSPALCVPGWCWEITLCQVFKKQEMRKNPLEMMETPETSPNHLFQGEDESNTHLIYIQTKLRY